MSNYKEALEAELALKWPLSLVVAPVPFELVAMYKGLVA